MLKFKFYFLIGDFPLSHDFFFYFMFFASSIMINLNSISRLKAKYHFTEDSQVLELQCATTRQKQKRYLHYLAY